MGPESITIVFGVIDISTRFENHEHESISDFWKVKVKSKQFPGILNIPTEL